MQFSAASRLAAGDHARIAKNITELSPYTVGPGRIGGWEFRLRDPYNWFRLEPLLRTISGAREPVLIEPDFSACTLWEVGPQIPQEMLQPALNRLDTLSSCKTLADFYALQEGVYALMEARSASEAAVKVRRAALTFHRLFPTGSVDILLKGQSWLSGPSIVRSLGRLAVLGIEAVRELTTSRGLSGGLAYPDMRPRPYYQILTNLGSQGMGGFVLNSLEWDLIFDCGTAIPLAAHEATLDRLRGSAVDDVLLSSRPRSAEYPLIESVIEERGWVRVWITERLANLFTLMAYLGTYADRRTLEIDAVRQWANIGTLHDITVLTNRLVAADDPSMVTLLSFAILDRYGTITGRSVDELLLGRFLSKATQSVDPALSAVHRGLRAWLEDARDNLVGAVWQGIQSDSVRSGYTITLRERGGASREVGREQYTRLLLRTLRNTTHGYDLGGGTFEQVLVMHSGTVPVQVRNAVIGLLFALLADPHVFLDRRTRCTDVNFVRSSR